MSDPGARGPEGREGTAVWGCAGLGLAEDGGGGPLVHRAAYQARVLAPMLGLPGRAAVLMLAVVMVIISPYFVTIWRSPHTSPP